MGKLYFKPLTFILTLLAFAGTSVTLHAEIKRDLADTSRLKATIKTASKIFDTRTDKPAYLKTDVKVTIVPFKPAIKPTAPAKTASLENEKVLSNVKIYPNPVSDQLNLTYRVNKDSNVTIKIMDALGNEVTTLLSQRLGAGDQNSSFNVASKLNSGFYFLRLVVGKETIIKRISVQ